MKCGLFLSLIHFETVTTRERGERFSTTKKMIIFFFTFSEKKHVQTATPSVHESRGGRRGRNKLGGGHTCTVG
jgi:hypothetical protein